MPVVARKFILAKKLEGAPKVSDYKIVEETLPPLQDGEILCKAEWLTVDPYMRARMNSVKVGDFFMYGSQVARVIESKNKEYPVGTKVVGFFGWRDHTIFKPDPKTEGRLETIYKMPDMKGLPDSYALGAVGMPGNTAYFGLLKICEPKPGNTLIVTSAAGAVGSIVGQIGKIKGCKVIGFAGSADKVDWVKNSLGFDQVYNYKEINIAETLAKEVPQRVDCYFDNVGGEFSYHVMRHMNQLGRIALCGAISMYNNDPTKPVPIPFDYTSMIYTNVRMEGFMVNRWSKEWFDGLHQLRDWIIEGKIKVEERVTHGFENVPQAFIDMLAGKGKGKAVIKV